jgi:hypothetical protein
MTFLLSPAIARTAKGIPPSRRPWDLLRPTEMPDTPGDFTRIVGIMHRTVTEKTRFVLLSALRLNEEE